MLPPYDMGTWARTLLDHEYDDDSEYNVGSYGTPVKEVEKELSPKSMKRYGPTPRCTFFLCVYVSFPAGMLKPFMHP